MKWIVQENFTERTFGSFMQDIQRMGCDVQFVRLYPFVDKIFPVDVTVADIDTAPEVEIDPNIPTVGIGSIKLNRILDERGITPGGFRNDVYGIDDWIRYYGAENVLNSDAVVIEFGKMEPQLPEGRVFIRPVRDDKAFAGKVFDKEFIQRWIENVNTLNEENSFATVTPETLVTLASVKQIYAEYRSFVVDGKVVTTSRYKLGDTVLASDEVDPDVVAYTQQLVDVWQPYRAFVLDVAATPDGFKMIEINGFGSSGFYACNVQKIIAAVEDMDYSLEMEY